MALPPPLRTSVTPPELELIASEQLVEIVPLIAMERTAFISVGYHLTHGRHPLHMGCGNDQGAYGPLRPPSKCKIPIWMATNLKLKKKCHIVPPEWLDVGKYAARSAMDSFDPAYRQE